MDTLKAKLAGARKSWTMWANGIILVVVHALPLLEGMIPQLQDLIPAPYRWVITVIVVGNMLLRLKTATALQDK